VFGLSLNRARWPANNLFSLFDLGNAGSTHALHAVDF
jgi:hypothetical protein